MIKNKKNIFILFLLMLTIFLPYKVKAEEILKIEKINQIFNVYNVEFNVINNNEVSTKYEKLGDTLEFNISIKNYSSTKNAILKNITIVTDNTGVDYSATMDKQDLELVPKETRTIKVKGVLTSDANNGIKKVKVQIHYNLSDEACTDCNKPIDVVINPKTGDTINLKIILLFFCIICLLLIVIYTKIKNKKVKILLLILFLSIILPIYTVKASSDYMIEVIINQIINIKKIDDNITIEKVQNSYTGNPVEGIFNGNTEITPTYYEDDQCQNPIDGKPINAGVYYATATSAGNKFYNPSQLSCTKVVEITKADVNCPNISNMTITYDNNNHSLIIGDYVSGGAFNFSLNGGAWTSEEIFVKEVGQYTIRTKIVGDNNHIDKDCGSNTITINAKVLPVDEITITEVTEDYSGNPVEGNFNGNTEITPTYYEDDQCQNPVNGKPINAGVYYATAFSSGSEDYNSGLLECTKAVTINKINSTCPTITDKNVAYDGELHSLTIGEGLSGGELNYSLNNGEWTNTVVKVREIGIYNIKIKVVGDNNHNNKSCGINTITINKKNDVISVEEVTENYTGYPIGGNFISESSTLITPTYYEDDQCQNPINGKPINAGVYYATAISQGNSIYNAGSLTCSKAITINKSSSSCPIINDLTVTYNGEAHSLEIGEGLFGGTLNYSLNEGEWNNELPSVVLPGTYVIKTKVVGDNNHEDTFCKNNTITINKANDTITSNLVETTYTGNPVEGNFNNLSNTDIIPKYYRNNSCTTEINGLPVNAGVYYATATSNGNDLYKSTSLSCTKAVIINNAESICPTIENVEVFYDGNAHSLEIGEGLFGGELNYSINEEAWTITNPTVTNVGTYSIKTKVVGDNNHNDKSCGTNTIKINKISDTITSNLVETTYTGNPVEGSFSNLSNTEIITTYYSDSNCNTSINENPRNPGVYYATATSNGNEIYNPSSLACTKAVTINKKNDVITIEEVEASYTGNEVGTNISNISNTDINLLYYTDNLCSNLIEGKPINAGVYYATATSNGNDYYNSSELTCTRAVTINVIEPTCPVINDVAVIYDGNSHQLNVGTGLVGGEMAYSINDSEFSSLLPSVENAGVYTINSKVLGDNNHSNKSCGTNTITIDQLGVMVMTSNQTKEYDGTPLQATSDCSFVGTYDGYSVSCTNSGSIIEVGETSKQIESVIIKKDNIDVSSNFIIVPSNGTLTITKAASICPTIQDVEVTYDGNPHQLNVGTDLVGGTLNYKLDDGEWTDIIPTLTNVGTYNIETKVIGDNNHNDTNCGSNKIKINKMADTITSNLVETTYTGSPVEGSFSNLSNTEITSTYYSDSSCSHELNGLPTNVGEYYATATSEGNNIYKSTSLSCTKVITITKAESVCPALGDITIMYDGNSHTITVGSGLVGGTLNYKLDDGEWTEILPTVKNVGVYSVKTKVVGDNNHNNKSCGTNTITIEKVPKLNDQITIEVVESQYTGSPVLANFSNISNSEITPTYYSDNSCSNSISELPVNVGDYYATAVSDGNDDYDSSELACTKAVTITKAPAVCPIIQNVEVIYDESSHQLNLGTGLVGGTLKYKVDSGEWTTDVPAKTNVGTYIVETKVVGDDNHTTTNCGSNTIIINKMTDTITANLVEATYTGNPVEGNFNNLSNTKITPTYYSDSSCTNELEDLPVNAGEYYAIAVSEGNDNYLPGNLTCTKVISINKAPSICPTIEDVEETYNGEYYSIHVNEDYKGGIPYFSINGSEYSSELPSKTNAGTYVIDTKVVGDDNHTDSTCGSNIIHILKQDITVITSNQEKVYDGEILYAENDCEIKNGTSFNIHCSNSGSIINVGTEPKVIDSVTIFDSRNNDITSNFNINKENGVLTVTPSYTATMSECYESEDEHYKIYNGNEKVLIEPNSDEHVSYSIESAVDAGNYTIAATTDPNYRFEDGTSVKTITCSIDKRRIVVTPKTQDIKYGTQISKTIDDIDVIENSDYPGANDGNDLAYDDYLYSVTLTQNRTEVYSKNDDVEECVKNRFYTENDSNNEVDDIDGCIGITASNLLIYNENKDVTNNYEITYNDGSLLIHYELTFETGDNCYYYDTNNSSGETIYAYWYYKEFSLSNDYSNRLLIRPNDGYSDSGLKQGDNIIQMCGNYNGYSDSWDSYSCNLNIPYNPEEFIIDGNNTYTSVCLDIIPPDVSGFNYYGVSYDYSAEDYNSDREINMRIEASDMGSGINKIELYYRKCGDSNYSKAETTFDPEQYTYREIGTNSCLSYGDYYIYAVISDADGNETTTEEIEYTLDKPSPNKVSIDNNQLGTSCKTLDCAVRELSKYYSGNIGGE